VSAADAATPIATPSAVSFSPPPSTRRRRSDAVAPTASLTLNSRARCCTVNIRTLKMPDAASIIDRMAKAATTCVRRRGRAVDCAATCSIVRTCETAWVGSTRAIARFTCSTIRSGAAVVRTIRLAWTHGLCAAGT